VTEQATSKGEKAVFWVGSLAGIATSLFTIYDRLLEPAPPKLVVSFFESGSTTLRIDPPVDTSATLIEEIPMQIKVENRGGKASSNTKLYLTHRDTMQLTATYLKESKPTWDVPNQPMRQLSLALENLNPGESYLIPIKVRFVLLPEQQRLLRMPASELEKSPLAQAYDLFADASSDTAPNVRTVLTFVLGRCDVLAPQGDVFWVGHDEDGGNAHLLKVKEDYPCFR